eukprot:Sspe_Gene.36917::Locus_17831_Transcript_1_1_Confidence_1.000_Length_789::g.36917::m.36917/K11143/DNAI2; dynein intermediate chain 2, axonemal
MLKWGVRRSTWWGQSRGRSCCATGRGRHRRTRSRTATTGTTARCTAWMRNPHSSKYFLSVGDWTARLWTAEDAQLRTPMFTTYYHKAYLTNGTWHPARPGVFLTTRMDGVMDVWDLLYRQTAPVLSVHISDFAINTLQCTHEGRHVAVGGVDGNTVLLELSSGLSQIQHEEKNTIEAMFSRESSRDRAL